MNLRRNIPCPARIMLVGDVPSADDVGHGKPFSDSAGQELNLMLHEVGITQAEIYLTNVCKYILPYGDSIDVWLTDVAGQGKARGFTSMPGKMWAAPQIIEGLKELEAEIVEVNPTVIIALGNTALWALTENTGITSWRGSILEGRGIAEGRKVIPTYHPEVILKQWAWRPIAVHDLRRAASESAFPEVRYPAWNFHIQPSFQVVMETLWTFIAQAEEGKKLVFSADFETIRHEIACLGLAWSTLDAMCIPFRTSREYWSLEEELSIVLFLRRLLTHKNVTVIFQNGSYDVQYFATQWLFIPNITDDTMVMQHIAYLGSQKSLDYLGSMYCEFYQYWKDDLKDYKTAPTDDNKFFVYNCRDCVYTLEVAGALRQVLVHLKLLPQYEYQIAHVLPTLVRMMLRGVAINRAYRTQLLQELMEAATVRKDFIDYVVGYELNPKSSKQMAHFLYTEMGLPPVKHRKTKKITANVEAMLQLADKFPLIRPVAEAIIEQRSIGTFISSFVQAEMGRDGRMHTSYNIAGTETLRLSSSTDVFGTGLNLQNIPSGNRKKTRMTLPNVRKMFIPDPGYEIFDIDQAGADAQVVAWEAGDEQLKQAFRAGLKIHAVNAKELFGGDAGPDGKREPYYTRTKMGVHLTNYGGRATTMAKSLGITVREAERFQTRWFAAHPDIKRWHNRIERCLQTTRQITNAFGFRRMFFDRIQNVLPEALGWIPQSTVAIITNKAMVNLDENLSDVKILLQVHDSIVFQLPIDRPSDTLDKVKELTRIVVPYPDPLIIPWGIKSSTVSWGHCE